MAIAADLRQLPVFLPHLNPSAHVVEAEFGQVRPTDLVDTCLYYSSTPAHYATSLLLKAHGIGAVRFCNERPFHLRRFSEFVRQSWPAAVLRL